MTTPDLQLRALTLDDIPAAQRLRELAKWNQIDDDWRHLIGFEPNGCFAAIMDQKVVGTATTTRYTPNAGPGSFGWVGMVLVDPEYRRHGIGSTLLKKCIQYLKDCGVETVKLDATPMGKLVYEKLGFVAEYELERWEGVARAFTLDSEMAINSEPGIAIAHAKPADLPEIVDFDAAIFGARRAEVLEAWYRAWPERCFVARQNGAVKAYGLARRGTNFQQIGPVVGDQRLSANVLSMMLTELEDERVVVDAVTSNPWAKQAVEACGLKHQRPFLRMAFGANSSPGKPESMLAICCPELG